MNMTRLAALLVLLTAVIISGCSTPETIAEQDIVMIGYCPTMAGLAKEIQSKNSHVFIVPFEYTAAALSALNKEEIDAVLVGRLATGVELSGTFELRLREGLTLVGKEKRLIYVNELHNSRVHTYVSEEQAKEYLPPTADVVYHDSLQETLDEGLDELVLIDWQDYTDAVHLVIPVDQFGNKVEKYRIPVLYSYSATVIEDLQL